MDPVLLSLVAGVVGLAIGVAGMLAHRASEAQRRVRLDSDEPVLPKGAADVLSVVGRAYVIVDGIDGVVRASPAAYAFGLVRGHTIVHRELLDLTARVRRDGVIEERQLELPRGPLGQGTIIVQARVAALGEEYILILADDRTEITRTEEIRNDFVANVSHELKTPVGAISLLAEALDDAASDEVAVRRFAQRMHKESGRLSALVQDIIELSRLQGTDVVRRGKPVNINSVIAEAVDRNKLPAESKQIDIVVGGKIDAPVYGDPDLLMTAFRNLIDNAIRYSPDGTRVGIGLRSRDGLAQISVTDQGLGITAEEQERIFERFYRIDAARSRQTGGTGLGLSIVKHVVSNHGGEVTVWSQQGQGSTFTVRLPEMETADDAGTGPAASITARAEPENSHEGAQSEQGNSARNQGVKA
ncbi:cell wall metabolism sensor histidine kinase WalK [uncultured Arthrobacter sp.]|uniref:sensor histidine kinase n=1 Tax=uncultured Arthrobacter sp. TaxID=114050 RepID=UPI0026128ADD|nr:ATP-binding protein [uncultured Arthrobacter sp.]